MSEEKQTFVDPKTEEEIESTWLARLLGRLFGVLFGLLGCYLFSGGLYGLFAGLFGGLLDRLFNQFGWLSVEQSGWVTEWLFGWVGIVLGIVLGVRLGVRLNKKIHDKVVREQHLYRQLILRRQEYPHVPDTALSRAQLPGKPEPTDASLSQTEVEKEGKPRLAEAVEEETRPGLWQSIKARLGK